MSTADSSPAVIDASAALAVDGDLTRPGSVSETVAASTESSPSSADDGLLGLAMLGKTAGALALIVIVILGLAALLKRRGLGRTAHRAHLQVVGSTAVGNRERVVVVEVEDRWLVLGVGGGQITPLDSLPARGAPAGAGSDSGSGSDSPQSTMDAQASAGESRVRHDAGIDPQASFGARFAQAMKANLGGRGHDQ
ncbi:flagellar biosynthetic protein FliO [Halomonas sp. V046]|uniref:flagellar biosynthetic protein FliO n=1 Tax=Halomonas sp. V046 TaxID=3459611 RepID=UPI0040446D3F